MGAPGSFGDSQLKVDSRVFIHGLISNTGAVLNFNAGRVVKVEEGGRLGIHVLTGRAANTQALVKRMNLLSASSRYDRELFLGLLTLYCTPELRVVRPALNTLLNEDVGLLLLVASYVRHPRSCLFQFGGYMGKVWDEQWCYADPKKPLALKQKPAPRLDAACSDMGLGRVLFAGGCGKHPGQCELPHGFYKTAEIYDSLSDEWFAIADMPTRRHGSTACQIGSKVYVLGGMYVDERNVPDEDKFCDMLDVDSAIWTSLPSSDYDHLRETDAFERGMFDNAAFFGAGAVGGRLVVLLKGVTLAYNPTSRDGWRIVEAREDSVMVGQSSCAATFEGELVVASGRPTRFAQKAAAFSFSTGPEAVEWWRGSWRQLPDLEKARVGGSLAVVHGRLYVTGGVDETTGQFQACAERLEGHSWVRVPWFKMPRALHAHDSYALPYLYT
ncbi:unnamed protein product [Polarella glacialis]|uniref:Uncharacterized protein n=1 Tax=Polarella glacialis TaxID=89957 RepID=A0A813LMU6_POLGL|nr:unnamed protein product [Polarella glacialis]